MIFFIKCILKHIIFLPKKIYRQLKYRPFSTISDFKPHNTTVYVLGNGPSLNQSIEKYESIFKMGDCVVVNSFATTDYYSLIQPNIYVLADPAYFENPNNLTERLKKLVLNITESLIKKTNWELSLIIPSSAKGSFLYNNVKANTYIKFYFYNNIERSVYCSEKSKFKLWNKNLIAPPAQTVLNTCLYLATYWRYPKIYLFGADTSWHENWYLDQNTNELYTIDKHFYNKEGSKTLIHFDSMGKELLKLHEDMYCVARALENYWELKSYATYNQVQIFNSSEYSWIDSFDRVKP